MLDLKRNMLTLPYIYVINNLDKKDKILSKIKYYAKKNDYNNLRDIIYSNGGIDYTKQMIDKFSNKAYNQLKEFEDSKYKSLLIDSIEFNMERKF